MPQTREHQEAILRLFTKLRDYATSGYAIALHVRFITPTYLFRSYSKSWTDLYNHNGYVMQDPTVLWAFSNSGTIRWSELQKIDSSGMLLECQQYGMQFGVTVVTRDGDSFSLASFSRPDREYSDCEISEISINLRSLHNMTLPEDTISAKLEETLRSISQLQTLA